MLSLPLSLLALSKWVEETQAHTSINGYTLSKFVCLFVSAVHYAHSAVHYLLRVKQILLVVDRRSTMLVKNWGLKNANRKLYTTES